MSATSQKASTMRRWEKHQRARRVIAVHLRRRTDACSPGCCARLRSARSMRRTVCLSMLVTVLAAVVATTFASAQSESTLRGRIGAAKGQERSLGNAVARLGRLERATARDVAVLERRVGDVQAEVAAAEA